MLLNLKQLSAGSPGDGKTLDFAHSLDLSHVKMWGENPFSKPVDVSGRVALKSGVYTLKYRADFEISGLCSRCLSPVARPVSREFSHTVLVDSENDAAEAEGFISARGAELDLSELAVSDILLEFSGVTLCREDCRGLCAKCGKNLNKSGCGCDSREPDPRFDAIRKLLQE